MPFLSSHLMPVCCLQPRLHAANAMPWTNMEDSLLCAVIHEFGPNYAFAAEILKSCCALSGICRRAVQCKERFKHLTVSSHSAGVASLVVENVF